MNTLKPQDSDSAFVLLRWPGEPEASKLTCAELRQYASLADIPVDASGFIVAPFEACDQNPVFLLSGVASSAFDLAPHMPHSGSERPAISFAHSREAYSEAFAVVKDALLSGRCSKVVLSRTATASVDCIDALALFASACHTYPLCYVALISIPGQGMWLTATPELLYSQSSAGAHTMALAGTMPWQEYIGGTPWTDKNIREQQLVTDYITSTLSRHGVSHSVGPQHTVKAGHLAHLCSRVDIAPAQGQSALSLLQMLHPTPAVAGIPLGEALSVIRQSEGLLARGYYAGFTGFLGHPLCGTRCYVSLRLLHIDAANRLTLYAGGGILPESTEESEWQETELKLHTMKALLCQ